MSIGRSRTRLGPRFSEGARQSWLALRRLNWTQTRLQSELRSKKVNVTVTFWLYGDRKPDRPGALAIEELLGVALPLWDEAPRAEFSLDVPAEPALAATGTGG